MASNILLYNPDQKTKADIIQEFVIRHQEFESIYSTLQSSDLNHPPQHFLIQGQRGMGKTTLLLRLKYAIEDDPSLSSWLLPVKFSEEQYHISRLEDLWESIAEMLETQFDGFKDLQSTINQWENENDFEERAAETLVKALKNNRKRILVMIDNLGDLFEKFGDHETHRLRQVLLSHSQIQLMSASAYVLEHTFQYNKAFYEFFQIVQLKPITREQSIALMRVLGEKFSKKDEVEIFLKTQAAKMEVLRRFTGGVPRTMALLFGIFMDHQSGSTFESLQLLLDEVNSLYKHRMDELKPQQQKIMDTLAKAWEPISTKQILEQSKLYRADVKSNQISAQLKSMEDNQLIESIDGPGKNKTYRIRERFFNIWYLMRYGKNYHKEGVQWLVKFLEEWCEGKVSNKAGLIADKILNKDNSPKNEQRVKTYGYEPFLESETSTGLGFSEPEKTYQKEINERLEYFEKTNQLAEMLALAEKMLEVQSEMSSRNNIHFILFILLRNGQFHFLYKQFKKPELNLMKYARPYWYVLMWFMKTEYPGEFEKVGSEIKETVDEIIVEIQEAMDSKPSESR